MVSIVSICNMALANLGSDRIEALSDAGAEARACRLFYDQTRDTLLQAYPWRFAGKTQALAMLTNDKPGKWKFAYQLPNDFLKIRSIRPEYTDTDYCLGQTEQQEISNPYDIEGQTIYCNIENAFLRYTYSLNDPTKYTPLFIDALAWALTVRFAMPLTRDMKQRADAYKLAQVARGEAETADAAEFRETSDHQTEFVDKRDIYDNGRYRRGYTGEGFY